MHSTHAHIHTHTHTHTQTYTQTHTHTHVPHLPAAVVDRSSRREAQPIVSGHTVSIVLSAVSCTSEGQRSSATLHLSHGHIHTHTHTHTHTYTHIHTHMYRTCQRQLSTGRAEGKRSESSVARRMQHSVSARRAHKMMTHPHTHKHTHPHTHTHTHTHTPTHTHELSQSQGVIRQYNSSQGTLAIYQCCGGVKGSPGVLSAHANARSNLSPVRDTSS
jgi:hypothetical protein